MAEPMDAAELGKVLPWLLAARRAESGRISTIREYLKNRVCDIYVPKSATAEYKQLVDQAKFNILPLLVNSVAQGLFVDGYRPANTVDNSPVWDAVWQPNRMDARQSGLYRAALRYGYSYAVVLPGDPVPVITPYSPRRLTALYEDPINDEWPQYAVTVGLPHVVIDADTPLTMATTITVLDDNFTYTTDVPAAMVMPQRNGEWTDPLPMEGLSIDTSKIEVNEHGLGVCPVVRFCESYDDLDDGPTGVVEPMLPAQRQLNQTTFGLLMTQHYEAFKQRWVTGMAIAEDEDGNPIEPWNAAVNRVWQAESPDTKFGEFSQADLKGYLDSRDKTLLYVASARQIPPHTLVVGNAVSNVSAEALAALEAGHQLDIGEHKTAFGESVEQMLRLCGKAMDDEDTWEDTSAQVVWRDTTPRSLAQVADALGKLAQLLDVPPRALWERIPGVTETDIKRWEMLAEDRDSLGDISQLLAAPAPGADAPPVPGTQEPAATGAPEVPAAVAVPGEEAPRAQPPGAGPDPAVPAAGPQRR
ncbi:phage portal protein [Streptomyces sp. NPDC057877]|uniref:phage portal protein n=1 Tax=Streptomyces sp. NPDC057877 TaxID=3346269 RepID=UPI0036BE46D9